MKSQKRVIASMLAAMIVLTLLIVFPHAETASQNSCDSCTESGISQSSVMEKAFGVRQKSSAGRTSAIVQNSRSNPTSKARQNISSGQTSAAGKSSSEIQASSAGQQPGFVQPSSGVVSSAKETPKNNGSVSPTGTIRNTVLTDAEISPQTIADGLGTAVNFAVFARKFTLNSHMEGNVAVQTFAATTGNIGNSVNVYTHNQNSITFDLTISISGIANHDYHVGIYTGAEAKDPSQEVTLKADKNGNAATTVSGLDSKKVYDAYLLDDSGNPISGSGTSQQGITGGGSVIYSCNDNYIQTLTDPDDYPKHKLPINWDLFQNAQPSSSVIPQSVTFGNTYRLYDPNVKPPVYKTTGNGNYALIDSSNKQNVINKIGGGTDNTVSIKDTFPFAFNDVFVSLSDLSVKLSKVSDCNNGTMRVINVAPSGNDDNALKDALINVLNCGDNDLLDPAKGIQLAAHQYLVVNVNCENKTSVTIPPCCIGTVNYDADWDDISCRILWNFYGGSNSLTVKTTSGVLGTILAPSATVNYNSTMNGAIYADTVYNGTGEIHKMTFRPTPNVTRSISFTDNSPTPFTLPETGGPGTGIFYLAGGGILFLAAVAVLIHTAAKQVISAKGKQLINPIGVFRRKYRLSIYPQLAENDSS